MTHYRRSPRSMQAALTVLADDLAPQTLLGDVQRVWSEVVGPSIAAESFPALAATTSMFSLAFGKSLCIEK